MNNIFFQTLTYFVIYSFLGWAMESIVRTISEKKLINTGFLFGPFCPIYGFGAAIMILFLSKFKNNIIILFFMSMIILSIWEYIVGVFLEKFFKTKYWDYSNHKFNFQGRVCLTNSLAWGFLGVLLVNYIHPFILSIIELVQFEYIAVPTTIISIILLIDAIISTIKVKNLQTTLQKIEDLNEQIKEKLLELKERETNLANANIQSLIDNLKIRKAKIIKNVYKRAYRLKKAFPAIETKEFTEILNKKIEFTEILNKKIDLKQKINVKKEKKGE